MAHGLEIFSPAGIKLLSTAGVLPRLCSVHIVTGVPSGSSETVYADCSVDDPTSFLVFSFVLSRNIGVSLTRGIGSFTITNNSNAVLNPVYIWVLRS